MKNSSQKSRYWTAVCYPENMEQGWQDSVGDVLQLPYAYCVHNRDIDKSGEARKEHVHVVVAFPNTTTRAHALSVFQGLDPTISHVERVISIRHMYDYLIHDTEDARKSGKYLYDKSERVTGNSFDIGAYEQVSITEKRELVSVMARDIVANRYENFLDFYEFEIEKFEGDDMSLAIEVLQTYSGFFERLTRGAYQRGEAKRRRAEYAMHRDSVRIDEATGEVEEDSETASDGGQNS